HARRPGRRRGDPDDRGPHAERQAPPAPGGVSRAPWPPVRVLHAGHAHHGARLTPDESVADRRGDPRGHLRRPLPLHRLPRDPQGRRSRRADDARSVTGIGGTEPGRTHSTPPTEWAGPAALRWNARRHAERRRVAPRLRPPTEWAGPAAPARKKCPVSQAARTSTVRPRS